MNAAIASADLARMRLSETSSHWSCQIRWRVRAKLGSMGYDLHDRVTYLHNWGHLGAACEERLKDGDRTVVFQVIGRDVERVEL